MAKCSLACLTLVVATAPASAQAQAPEASPGQLVWSTSTPLLHVYALPEGAEPDLDANGCFLGTGDGGADLAAGRYRIHGGPTFARLWASPEIVSVSPRSVTRIAVEYVDGAEFTIAAMISLSVGLALGVTTLTSALTSGPLDQFECLSAECLGLTISMGVTFLTGLILGFLGEDARSIRVTRLAAEDP